MLFDLAPKRSKRDFYNYEKELEQLYKLYLSSRVVAVVGCRRIGKTSLILTFLSEWKAPHIFVDCRRISFSSYGASFRSFAEEFSRALNEFLSGLRGRAGKLLDYLRSVKGVEIDFAVGRALLRWGKRDRSDIASLLEKLDTFAREEGFRVALVFDELQELRAINIDFAKLLAYIYDHLHSTVAIVSGSQVGLLYDTLKIEDPASPMYGRAVAELRIPRLPREKAVEFLEKGFAEVGVEVSRDIIEKAVDALDGVVGWLVYFGWSYVHGVKDLGEVLDTAARQEAEELKRFLARSRNERRYREILKAVAQGRSRWSEIKRAVELAEGVEVDDKNFSELLKKLVKAGFIEKTGEEYIVPDPITARAILKHL